jgi:hypothetical protein
MLIQRRFLAPLSISMTPLECGRNRFNSHSNRHPLFLILDQLYQVVQTTDPRRLQARLVRPRLHVERGLYRLIDDTAGAQPRLGIGVVVFIGRDLDQVENALGGAIRGFLYPEWEYVRFVA